MDSREKVMSIDTFYTDPDIINNYHRDYARYKICHSIVCVLLIIVIFLIRRKCSRLSAVCTLGPVLINLFWLKVMFQQENLTNFNVQQDSYLRAFANFFSPSIIASQVFTRHVNILSQNLWLPSQWLIVTIQRTSGKDRTRKEERSASGLRDNTQKHFYYRNRSRNQSFITFTQCTSIPSDVNINYHQRLRRQLSRGVTQDSYELLDLLVSTFCTSCWDADVSARFWNLRKREIVCRNERWEKKFANLLEVEIIKPSVALLEDIWYV